MPKYLLCLKFAAKNFQIDDPYSKVDTEENQCVYQSSSKQQKQYCSLEPEINITQIDFSKQFQTEKNSMAKDSSSGYPKQDDMMQTNKQLNFNFESSCHQDDTPECQSDTFSLQFELPKVSSHAHTSTATYTATQTNTTRISQQKQEKQPRLNPTDLFSLFPPPYQPSFEPHSYQGSFQEVRSKEDISPPTYSYEPHIYESSCYEPCSGTQHTSASVEPVCSSANTTQQQLSQQQQQPAPPVHSVTLQPPSRNMNFALRETLENKAYYLDGQGGAVSVNQSKDNSRLENSMRNIEVQEDDIMKKYGDLFTAPDFLMQCKISIQNFSSQQQQPVPAVHFDNDFSGKLSWNFMACQSMVYSKAQDKPPNQEWDACNVRANEKRCSRDWERTQENRESRQWERSHQEVGREARSREASVEKKQADGEWEQRLKGIEKYRAEEIFDEIFSENTLNKISRAFFRFKMESILQNIQESNYKLDNSQLDELFKIIDTVCRNFNKNYSQKSDNFVDVNEMGYFLEQLCVVEENTSRKIFQFIDRDGKGFFESIDLARTLNEIQEQCEVNEIDDLMELEKIFFAECDFLSQGSFSYWEFYLKKNTISGSKINEIIQQFLDQTVGFNS